MDPHEQIKLAQQTSGSFRNYSYSRPAGAPKEIGLLLRIEGVLTGVEEVRNRIEALSGRIHGEPAGLPDGANAKDRQSGMPAALSQIEGEIRECLSLLGRLEDQLG